MKRQSESPFEVQSEKWCFTIHPLDGVGFPHEFTRDFLAHCLTPLRLTLGCKFWFQLHNKDFDKDGLKERDHFHVVFKCYSRVLGSRIFGDLCSAIGYPVKVKSKDGSDIFNPAVGIERVSNMTAILRYLCHLDEDDKLKHRYDPMTVFPFDLDYKCAVENISADFVNVDSLEKICRYQGSRLGVLRYIGVSNYNRCFKAIETIFEDIASSKARATKVSKNGK